MSSYFKIGIRNLLHCFYVLLQICSNFAGQFFGWIMGVATYIIRNSGNNGIISLTFTRQSKYMNKMTSGKKTTLPNSDHNEERKRFINNSKNYTHSPHVFNSAEIRENGRHLNKLCVSIALRKLYYIV